MTEESKPQDLGMDPHGLQPPSESKVAVEEEESRIWSLVSSLILPCSREFVGLFIGFSGLLPLA